MTADTSSGYNSYRRSCLMFRVIMRTTGLALLCLASIPAQSSGLPQTDSLALKSQRAKQLMAEGNFAQAIPLPRAESGRAQQPKPDAKSGHGTAHGWQKAR